MSASDLLTPARRDALLALAALALLAGPLWASALHVGDPTYEYRSARVVTDDEHGLAYANQSGEPGHTLISEDVGCSIGWEARVCAFERYLAANHTVPTGVYTNNPDLTSSEMGAERYRYVLVDGTAYETVYVPNTSVRNDEGMYRLDLALEPVSAEGGGTESLADVLRAVSLPASRVGNGLPPVVLDAARDGVAYGDRRVDVPRTPVRLDDGTYHRVYFADRIDPAPAEHFVGGLLVFVAPLVGLALLAWLWERVEVTHVGTDGRR